MKYDNDEKKVIVNDIITIILKMGETMPSKMPALEVLINGVKLVMNAMGPNVVNDDMEVRFHRCDKLMENIMSKKCDVVKVGMLLFP